MEGSVLPFEWMENMKESDKIQQLKYQRENLRQVKFALNRETDKDVIEHVEKQPNIRQYIIGLIRKDMQT